MLIELLKEGLLLACFCIPAAGQLVTADGGRGMAGEPSGGVLGLNFGNWELTGSMGVYNGSIVGGGTAKVQLGQKWNLKAGDQDIEVGIPTDINFRTGTIARGASLSYAHSLATHISIFAGMAGGGYSTTNILFFTPQIPLGALSIDHYLDSKKRYMLFTRALFSNQQTVLGGALYTTKKLQAGFAVGTGSNQPHMEAILDYQDTQWDIRGGYLYSGNRFQMLMLPQFRTAQQDRANITVNWTIKKANRLTAIRHEYLYPTYSRSASSGSSASGPLERGSTNSIGGVLTLHGLGVGADVYESHFERKYGSAAAFLASQRLVKFFYLNENYYLPLHATNSTPMFVVTAYENLNRRLTMTEFATHTNKQWTVNYGGSLRWDRFDINVGYTTNFIPLEAGGSEFKQAMNLDGHLNVGRWQFAVRTYVQPDGRVLYGYEVKSYYFRPFANSSIQSPMARSTTAFPNYLIAGMVTLEDTGKPVADVPIRIGDETVYTDDDGCFTLRAAKKRIYKLQLQLDHQIGAHYYEQVSGSPQIMAGTDDAPGQVQFVVRVDKNKIPSAPQGGIVIGRAEPSVADFTATP
jgi:hypothetical protein